MNINILSCLTLTLNIMYSSVSASDADIAVIVHPENLTQLSDKDLNRLFLGKKKVFSTGKKATPIYLSENNDIRKKFDKKVLKKSARQTKAYWARLLFTGRAVEPQQVSNDSNVIQLVAENPELIGYISVDAVTDAVRVVKILQ